MQNNKVIVLEILFYHTKMNGLAFHVDITYLNESMNSLKYNEKKIKFINTSKYVEHKIFCFCVDVYKVYEDNDYDEIYETLSTLKSKKLKN